MTLISPLKSFNQNQKYSPQNICLKFIPLQSKIENIYSIELQVLKLQHERIKEKKKVCFFALTKL